MKPPTPNRWDQIVAQVIREHPEGISFRELQRATSTFTDELAALTRDLRDAGVIERRDGRLFLRTKKKPPPAPLWARIKNVFRPA